MPETQQGDMSALAAYATSIRTTCGCTTVGSTVSTMVAKRDAPDQHPIVQARACCNAISREASRRRNDDRKLSAELGADLPQAKRQIRRTRRYPSGRDANLTLNAKSYAHDPARCVNMSRTSNCWSTQLAIARSTVPGKLHKGLKGTPIVSF